MKRFAFIIHLRTIEDLVIAFPLLPKFLIPVLRYPILYLFERLKGRSGFMVRSKFKVGERVDGYILLILLTGEQIMSIERAHKVRRRILEAVLYAQDKLNCNIIGLGALTSSVTNAGQWLVRQPEIKAAITHGDSYSVCAAAEGIKKAAKLAGFDFSRITVAIVGATGIVGEGLVYQLAPLVRNRLILIGRNSKKLEAVRAEAKKIGSNPTISLDIDDIGEADIVVTATSWPKALVGANHLKNGAIIYEVSQPRNVSPSLLKERPDILLIDGAYVSVPNDINFWWMGRLPYTTFACMAETTMQALEGDLENHIGSIDPVFVKEVQFRAKKYGFSHAPFTSFNKKISQERFRE